MKATERRVWDQYMGQLAEREGPVNGLSLRRLCRDHLELETLWSDRDRLIRELTRTAREARARLRVIDAQIAANPESAPALEPERTELLARRRSGGARLWYAETIEGQRIDRSINTVEARIDRRERGFGLTRTSAARLEESGVMSMPPVQDLSIYEAIQ